MARIRTPRVGILVECGRRGLEDVICRRLCALLREHTGVEFEEEIVPMDNKPNRIETCGAVTANLFASGCDRVVILWDERPAWPKVGEPSRRSRTMSKSAPRRQRTNFVSALGASCAISSEV